MNTERFAASSPVCEAELCTFRDSWQEISDLGAHIVAISNDGPFANKAFVEKHNFNFPLLGDYNSKTIRDYDILMFVVFDVMAIFLHSLEVLTENFPMHTRKLP